MKRYYLVVIIYALMHAGIEAQGQRWKLMRYEADLYISSVAFHGDIGLADKPLLNNINGMRPSVGFKPGFRLRDDLTVCLDLSYLMYGGKDEEGSSHGRLYSFNTQGFQHVAKVEYFILGDSRRVMTNAVFNRRGMVNDYNKLYLYVYAGVGGVVTKTKIKDLNDGGAEPLSNPSYNNALNYGAIFPIGGGIKWAFDPRWNIGIELGYQFTLTDYLDGYKSPFSKYNDSYYLTSIKAIMKIHNDRNNKPVFRKLYR